MDQLRNEHGAVINGLLICQNWNSSGPEGANKYYPDPARIRMDCIEGYLPMWKSENDPYEEDTDMPGTKVFMKSGSYWCCAMPFDLFDELYQAWLSQGSWVARKQ